MLASASSQIGERSVVEDSGSRIPNIEQDLIEGAVLSVHLDQPAQRFRVAKGSQRAIDGANDLAQENLGRIAS